MDPGKEVDIEAGSKWNPYTRDHDALIATHPQNTHQFKEYVPWPGLVPEPEKPKQKILGLSVCAFWTVVIVIVLILAGAIGGGVGGGLAAQKKIIASNLSAQNSAAACTHSSSACSTASAGLQTTTSSPSTTASSSSTTSATPTSLPSLLSNSSCPSSIPVTFSEIATTNWGSMIKLAGNVSALGTWAPSQAVLLSAADYTSEDPVWEVTLNMAPGEAIQYKYLNVDGSGDVTWEGIPDGPNETYVVPECTPAATVSGTWSSFTQQATGSSTSVAASQATPPMITVTQSTTQTTMPATTQPAS